MADYLDFVPELDDDVDEEDEEEEEALRGFSREYSPFSSSCHCSRRGLVS
jgi:hypothetical protein